MAVKLTDIAIEAGVSRGTVDRALHHRGGVNPEVEKRILEIAQKHRFVPNRAGKVLAAQKRAVRIGCLLPGIENIFFEDIIKGIRDAEKELADYNVSVDVHQVKGYDERVHMAMLEEMAGHGYSGLCLTTLNSDTIRNRISELFPGVPIVSVNVPNEYDNSICYVGPDYYKDGLTASGMFSMITHEKQDMLFFTGSFHVSGHMERINGFADGLAAHGVPFNVVKILETNDDDDEAYRKTMEMLNDHSEISAIFCATAGSSGICRAVKESGRKLRLACFDDIPDTRMYVKERVIDFTICQEPILQGHTAVAKLFDYIMNNGSGRPDNLITRSRIKIAENIDED